MLSASTTTRLLSTTCRSASVLGACSPATSGLVGGLPLSREFSSSAPNEVKFKVSQETHDVLVATLPAVAEAGDNFTKHFYARMFKAVPCLKDVFNNTNQQIGKQPSKLFASVAEAAISTVQDRDYNEAMGLAISHKHCGLGIEKGAYSIVGEHLLGTISECLTDDPKVLNAWGELYGEFAKYLSEQEEGLYQATEAKEGGWRGLRDFKLMERIPLGDNIARFHFAPADGGKVCDFTSGQYITVWAKPEGWANRQPRHYTIATPRTEEARSQYYAVTIRKQGQMSDFLHEAEIGTPIQLSAPYGDFSIQDLEQVWTRDPNVPVVFLSAGVGITPTLSMLESLTSEQGSVTWLHASKSGRTHAYRSNLINIAERKPWLTRRVWYENPTLEDYDSRETNLKKFHFQGLMDLSQVEDVAPLHNENTIYYFCGPAGWMDYIIKTLKEKYGVTDDRLKYESF